MDVKVMQKADGAIVKLDSAAVQKDRVSESDIHVKNDVLVVTVPRVLAVALVVASVAAGCGGSTAPSTTVPGGGSGGADSGLDGSTSGVVTGRACSTDGECGAGFMCNTEAPGGYCMEGAPGGPTACVEPDHPCTAPGTVCSPLPWHQISGVCLRACATAADCRGTQQCARVELFPGDPSSPASPEPVCWFACQVGMDQSCNDNPSISSLHGECQADGTCTCKNPFQKNPATGRCL